MSLKNLPPERYRQVQAVFHAVEDGQGTPETLCDGDPPLLALVRELLAAAAQTQVPFPSQPDLSRVDEQLLGKQVGQYRVEEFIASGGMGSVFRCQHTVLNHLVAIKFLAATLMNTAEAVARFRWECQVLASLEHQYIGRLYEVGAHEGRPYMVMEFIDGPGLTAFQRGHADQGVAAKLALFLKVCDGVSHAHGRGVSHRDLKPANILVKADGTPRILDFGLADALSRARLVGEDAPVVLPALGTPQYMSPEQARQQPDVGPLSDQYSLGVILFELLTGALPYALDKSLTLTQIGHIVRQQPPQPLGPVTHDRRADLEAVVRKALAKEPAQRYASVAAFADELRRYLAVEPVKVRPVGRLRRAWYGVRRHPARAAARSLGALLVLGGLAVGLSLLQMYTLAEIQRGRAEDLANKHAVVARELAQAHAVGQFQKGITEDLLHQSRVKTAHFALRRGQWADARRAFDQAIADKNADQDELRVERLRCLYTLGARGELLRELEALAPLPLPDRLRAALDLHQGDVGLWEPAPERQEAARKQLEAALQAKAGLTQADCAYARGLLAEGTPEAIEHFRAALADDPFHHRANVALLLELGLSGQFDLARVRANFIREVLGADENTLYGMVLIAALRGDEVEVKEALGQLEKGQVDPDQLAVVKELFRDVGKRGGLPLLPVFLHHPLFKDGKPAVLVPDEAGWNQFAKLFSAPAMRRLLALVAALTEVQRHLNHKDFAAADRLATAAGRRHPESLLCMMHAVARFALAGECYQLGQVDNCQRELLAARSLALRASDAPTLLHGGPFRHNCRWLAFLIDATLLTQYRPHRPRLAAGLVGHAALAGHGPAPIQAVLAIPLAAYPPGWWPDRRLLLRLAHDGGPHDAARHDLFGTVVDLLEPDDSRTVLAAWAADAPHDLVPLRLRAKLELRTGDYHAALAFADRVLARLPDDAAAKSVRAAALKKLGK